MHDTAKELMIYMLMSFIYRHVNKIVSQAFHNNYGWWIEQQCQQVGKQQQQHQLAAAAAAAAASADIWMVD